MIDPWSVGEHYPQTLQYEAPILAQFYIQVGDPRREGSSNLPVWCGGHAAVSISVCGSQCL